MILKSFKVFFQFPLIATYLENDSILLIYNDINKKRYKLMRKAFYFNMKWMNYDKLNNTIFSKCSAKIYWIIDYNIENNLISKMVQFWQWLEPPFSFSSISITATRPSPPPLSATRSFAFSTFRTSGKWSGTWSIK